MGGSYVLAFFGITLAALRVAGGLVVALSGWRLLNAPETRENRKQEQAASPRDGGHRIVSTDNSTHDRTGHNIGGGRVGAGHPESGLGWFFLGMTAAAVAMTATIWSPIVMPIG